MCVFSLVGNASQALGVKEGVRVNGLLTWMSSDFYSSLEVHKKVSVQVL